MKNAFVIICFSIFPFMHSFSQIKVGLKAGLGLCNVKFPEPSDTKTRIAFYTGLQSEIAAGKKWVLQPGLLYSQKGFRFSPLGTIKGGHVSINYISVPLLVGYRPTDFIKVLAGPEFNFLTTAKSRIDGSSDDLSQSYKKFEAAIDLGIACQLQKNINVELRYCYGLSYLAEGTLMDAMGNRIGIVKLGKNRVLQAGIFYIF